MRDVESLHPKLRKKVESIKSLCQKQGLFIGIGECLRTEEEQNALFAKGRTQKGSIVTNARGSTYSSMHQWGVAFDFFRNDGRGAYNNSDGFFQKVGEIGKSIGLEWGGDWTSLKDMPHFQLPDWGSTPTKLKKQYGTPENFMKTWEIAMTDEERKLLYELKTEISGIKCERIYHYSQELPDWAASTIQKLVDKGFYQGSSKADLNLPETLMRVLVINDRAGLYD